MRSSSSFLPFIYHEQQFFRMRQPLIDQLTPRQSQVAANVAIANINNDQTDDTKPAELQEAMKKTGKKPIHYGDQLFVHYTHEKRFESFKRDMHTINDNVFKNTPVMDLKLIVGSRNSRDTRNELVRKRPKLALLQNKRIKRKYLKLLGKKTSSSSTSFIQFPLTRATKKNKENFKLTYYN